MAGGHARGRALLALLARASTLLMGLLSERHGIQFVQIVTCIRTDLLVRPNGNRQLPASVRTAGRRTCGTDRFKASHRKLRF
jgi:hypothetical protein